MKNYKPIFLMAAGFAWFAAFAPGVSAQTMVGVSYKNGGDHINNTASDALLTTDVAGAVPQANWNNLGRWGDTVTLNDSAGAATSLFINWDSTGAYQSGSLSLGTPDGKLMDGYLDPSYAGGTANNSLTSVYGSGGVNKPLVYLSGLQAWLASQPSSVTNSYEIILYLNGDSASAGAGRISEHWIQAVTGPNGGFTVGADLTPHLFNNFTAAFTGTYVQVSPGATTLANAAAGNYMVFSHLTNDVILIRSSEASGYASDPINAFQIVPQGPNSPAVATPPVITPTNIVYAGSSVTITETASGSPTLHYQWQTDGGSGTITNIPGATSTNVTVVPANTGSQYTIQYDVIVSNSFSASTSLVSVLTVNPASIPIVTQDIAVTPPTVDTTVYVYAGGNVSFSAGFNGTQPIAYNWQSNQIPVLNATNTTLRVTNLQLSASGSTFALAATNSIGSATSSVATVTILADPPALTAGLAYPYAVYTNQPAAYWRLGETLDPALNSVQTYDYSGHNLNGTFGNNNALGQPGPSPSSSEISYVGFESGNLAPYYSTSTANGWVNLPDLNLNTNTVTFTAWINPYGGGEGINRGLLMWRGTNGDAAGFGFGSQTNFDGSQVALGYTWSSNSPASYNYNSSLFPPLSQWSFVAVTITPTNTALYLYYVAGGVTNLLKSVHNATNNPEAFSGGSIWLGSDPAGGTGGGRNFYGSLDEVAVFSHALTENQLQRLFFKSIGYNGSILPLIFTQPVTINSGFQGQSYQFNVVGGGAPPPTYQWQSGPSSSGPWSNVSDGGPTQVSGSSSATLTISNAPIGVYYQVVLANSAGSVTSSVVTLNLTPVPTGLWTVNFAVNNTDNGNTGIVYSGRGVLGNGTFWNAYNAYDGSTGTGTYRDDGVTPSGASMAMANQTGEWCYSPLQPILLLQPYASCGTNQVGSASATTVTFGNVPNGIYNLALYGIDGGYVDRGVTFTVNGSSQTLVNVQTASFAPGDNTALFTSEAVTNGQLVVTLVAADSPAHTPNGEGEFNGGQLQLVQGVGNPAHVASVNVSAGHVVIKGTSFDAGQSYRILTSTNLTLPMASWTPVATNTFATDGGFTNSIPVNLANPDSFYRVVEP